MSVTEQRRVYLLEAASSVEERVLAQWVSENAPATSAGRRVVATIPSARGGRRRRRLIELEQGLAGEDDPLLQPLRVAWFGVSRSGLGVLSTRDLIFGDPRDPSWLRQQWLLRFDPDRYRVVVGEPAPASELRRRWRHAGGSETVGLADFVARQATLALERAERKLRGARYKVPRFVHEDILGRPAFRGELDALARSQGRDVAMVELEAERYLREIAATHSPYVIDLSAHLIRMLYSQGYDERLHYDRAQLERIYALAQRHPVVFLPTHKSNLDHLVLQYCLHENGHPPNHAAGGINMNFFPVGPLGRRSGLFFIRRSFKDNAVYKFVLHQYIDYLVEKRFSLEWYIEGGRSRSGKLLPPRFGLLAYVADAYRRAKAEDVILIPTSIAYDQIQDVGDYVAEQRGAAKQAEGFAWFLGVVRSLRRRYGNIHLRFGEPLSLAEALGPPNPEAPPDAGENLEVQKLAFEVAVRINAATPVTATSAVTLALLGWGDRALTLAELQAALERLAAYIRRRRLPTSGDFALDDPEAVQRTLSHLEENGVVTCYDEGPEAVYQIGANQHLAAAYYRNTIIHFFVNAAIVELALLHAAESSTEAAVEEFWAEVMRLRDLLKFEFFFAEKEEFRREIREELLGQNENWGEWLAQGAPAILAGLRQLTPFQAHRVLRPFLEAYQVVADELARPGGADPGDEVVFLASCLALGRQYSLQRRIRHAESVSKPIFQNALKLAANRGIFGSQSERREEFAEELRRAVRRVDVIDAMASSRRAGMEG